MNWTAETGGARETLYAAVRKEVKALSSFAQRTEYARPYMLRDQEFVPNQRHKVTQLALTAPVLERLDHFADKAKAIFEKIWSMVAPPTGVIYILATGDVMGGGMIMAANPQVAKSMGTIASAIRAGTGPRQIESTEKL